MNNKMDYVIENNRQKLLDKLIKCDVSNYRRLGLLSNGKYAKEPIKHYLTLKEVYSQLSTESIEKLLEINPKNKHWKKI
jgi:hypothetical protein